MVPATTASPCQRALVASRWAVTGDHKPATAASTANPAVTSPTFTSTRSWKPANVPKVPRSSSCALVLLDDSTARASPKARARASSGASIRLAAMARQPQVMTPAGRSPQEVRSAFTAKAAMPQVTATA
jgi:hypothetical protein